MTHIEPTAPQASSPLPPSPLDISPIDMLTPYQTCKRLDLTPGGLLDLVNDGVLSAYDFEGCIRFRVSEVEGLPCDAFQRASTSSGIRRYASA